MTRLRPEAAWASSAAVLRAAIDLLGRRPQAKMEEIAAAAGVARQTVYAHYASREKLIAAIIDRITAETAEVLDGLDVADRPAPQALSRWAEASWQILGRYPILLTEAVARPPGDEVDRHSPISGLLVRLLERGRAEGQFDARVSGHLAGGGDRGAGARRRSGGQLRADVPDGGRRGVSRRRSPTVPAVMTIGREFGTGSGMPVV